MGGEDAAVGGVAEESFAGSITELTAGLTAIWASDFGAVNKLMFIP